LARLSAYSADRDQLHRVIEQQERYGAMSDFERDYYEAEAFWGDATFQSGANAARIRETASMIPADVRSVLDVGCGNGAFGNYLHRPGIDVLSIDRSRAALGHARTRTLEGRIDDLPVADRAGELVSCLQVLEHLPVPAYAAALKELARVASRFLLVSVPFEERIDENTTRCPECKSRFNVDLHLRSYDAAQFRRLFPGWRLVEERQVVPGVRTVGVETYQRLRGALRRAPVETFRAPICPVCGFRNTEYAMPLPTPPRPVAPPLKGLKALVTRALPKRTVPGYWILGLFGRE
jgi:SAM-dependent methyltransferase